MGLFDSYERKQDAGASAAAAAKPAAAPAAGEAKAEGKKQVPTPTRKQAEQARLERLHPVLTKKEIRVRSREQENKKRIEAMERQEAQPARVLLRDWIDSRRGLSSYTMPILLILMAIVLTVGYLSREASLWVSYGTWVVLFAVVVDVVISWQGFKKLARERVPDEPLKGLLAYAISRSINFRRFRQPPPRVKPGEKI
ncbi:MAG: DUF3043 domain-containing protein [Propionibacteriaceae bacterium]|jgi:hypothetical protein|nr:DUF3043 domain-containing protein [Propionibacteriaceae bacterium]